MIHDIEPKDAGPTHHTGELATPADRNIDYLQQTVGEWSVRTFPGSSPVTVTAHLVEEADELAEQARCLATARDMNQSVAEFERYVAEEAADCFLLLLGLAHRVGFSLFDAAEAKHAVNVGREWQPDARGYHKHIEVAS